MPVPEIRRQSSDNNNAGNSEWLQRRNEERRQREAERERRRENGEITMFRIHAVQVVNEYYSGTVEAVDADEARELFLDDPFGYGDIDDTEVRIGMEITDIEEA